MSKQTTKLVTLEVERVRTETALIQVPIDLADFEDWSGTFGLDPEVVAEYLEAHADFPDNIAPMLNGAQWTPRASIGDEMTLMVPTKETRS